MLVCVNYFTRLLFINCSDHEIKRSAMPSQRSIHRSGAVDLESDASGVSESMDESQDVVDPLLQNLVNLYFSKVQILILLHV